MKRFFLPRYFLIISVINFENIFLHSWNKPMIYFLIEYFCVLESFNSNISHQFLLQNNLCDFTAHEHKIKRWFCTQNDGEPGHFFNGSALGSLFDIEKKWLGSGSLFCLKNLWLWLGSGSGSFDNLLQ